MTSSIAGRAPSPVTCGWPLESWAKEPVVFTPEAEPTFGFICPNTVETNPRNKSQMSAGTACATIKWMVTTQSSGLFSGPDSFN